MSLPDASASNVIVYASPFCGYCGTAKRLLQNKSIDFTQIDMLFSPAHRSEMTPARRRMNIQCL